MNTSEPFATTMHKQILLDLEKQIFSEEMKIGVGDKLAHESQDDETIQQNFQQFTTGNMSQSESFDGSGVDAPPTPRSTNSEYDNLSRKGLTPAPPRLQTLNAHTLSISKPKFNSFLKTVDLEKSNQQILDQEINHSRTPLNLTSTFEHYNTTGLSQIANKNVVNQDTIKSRVQLDKFNLALKQKDKISGLNAQTDSNRIQAEPSHTCELLVTATEDDAHTPRYDTNPKAAQ